MSIALLLKRALPGAKASINGHIDRKRLPETVLRRAGILQRRRDGGRGVGVFTSSVNSSSL